MTNNHRRRQSLFACAAAAFVGSAIYTTISSEQSGLVTSFLRNNYIDNDNGSSRSRRLSALAQFTDPKSVSSKGKRSSPAAAAVVRDDSVQVSSSSTDIPAAPVVEQINKHFAPINHDSRAMCQIVYIVGVEGATHHGFIPIVENLAKAQTDHRGKPYHVDTEPKALKAGLFGWFYNGRIKKWGFSHTPEVDDPEFVQRVVQESCPDDGQKHVMIEWASFPSGQQDDKRTYRVRRQNEWLSMSPEEIANTDEALAHPTSINAFYQAYSPYVDVKFVVLHRPFLETIASHASWDGGPPTHSNIIRGFMLMLRRFLDMHVFDLVTGDRLWRLVCVERIMAKNYDTEHDVKVARRHVVANLARFLGWENGDCDQCFDGWYESTKDPLEVLGSENVEILTEHMKWLEGVWPPPGEPGVAEQQCGI